MVNPAKRLASSLGETHEGDNHKYVKMRWSARMELDLASSNCVSREFNGHRHC